MKRKIIICMIVLVIVLAFFVGKYIVQQYKNKSYVDVMKSTIEQYLRLSFSNVKFIKYDEIVDSSMALMVNGHINNNKDFYFTVIIGDNEVYGLGYGSALEKYKIKNSPEVLKKIKKGQGDRFLHPN